MGLDQPRPVPPPWPGPRRFTSKTRQPWCQRYQRSISSPPQGGLCHRHPLIMLIFRRDRWIEPGYQAWGLGPGLLGKEKLTGKFSNCSSRWLFLKLGIAWASPQVPHLKCTGNSSTLHLIEAAFLTTQAAINDNWSYRKDFKIFIHFRKYGPGNSEFMKWGGTPATSHFLQSTVCNVQCNVFLPVHCPISVQLPLLQKKILTHKFMTLASPYHKILTSKVLVFHIIV